MQPNGEDLLRQAEEVLDYTFIFLIKEDARWRRNVLFIPGMLSPDMAEAEFWLDHDSTIVMLAAGLHNKVRTVDLAFDFGHEPDLYDPDWIEQFNSYYASGEPRLPYTVFGLRNSHDGRGFLRYDQWIDAVDPTHAQLIARNDCGKDQFLIAGVVENHACIIDLVNDLSPGPSPF